MISQVYDMPTQDRSGFLTCPRGKVRYSVMTDLANAQAPRFLPQEPKIVYNGIAAQWPQIDFTVQAHIKSKCPRHVEQGIQLDHPMEEFPSSPFPSFLSSTTLGTCDGRMAHYSSRRCSL